MDAYVTQVFLYTFKKKAQNSQDFLKNQQKISKIEGGDNFLQGYFIFNKLLRFMTRWCYAGRHDYAHAWSNLIELPTC